jgi:hypothetical protein
MPRYRVIIHGENFRLKLEDSWEKVGFFTSRFADAPDPLLAEHTALEDFRQSTKYRDLIEMTLNSDDDPPLLTGEDIEEVDKSAGVGERPVGLALYRESDDPSAEPGAPPNGGPATRFGNSEVTEGPPSVS